MVKKMMVLAAVLAMVLLVAIPALAQQGDRAADRDVGAAVDIDRAPERAPDDSATPLPAPADGGPEDADGEFVVVPEGTGDGSVVPASGGGGPG